MTPNFAARSQKAARYARALRPIVLILPLVGCGGPGAPDFILFGAYFPGWMFCALVGVLGAIGARILMVVSGLSQILPFQLFISVAAGLIIATAAWLLWFGR